MSSLNLLPRGEFEFVSDGKTIKGRFCMWSLKRFCDKRQYSTFSDLQEIMTGGKLTLEFVWDFLLCAVEYKYRKEKKDFPFADVDASDWIEDLGGIGHPDIMALINHAAPTVGETGEKKMTVQSELISETYNESAMQPG